MRWVFGLACAASLMLCSCTRTIEESMLLRGPQTPIVPDDVWHEAVDLERSDGAVLRGIVIRSKDPAAPPRPLVVFYYGWGQTVASSTPSLYRLASGGRVDVLCMDLRGIGSSATTPFGGARLSVAEYEDDGEFSLDDVKSFSVEPAAFDEILDDALAIHDELAPELAEDGQPVYAVGHSLGTTLALELSARRELAGIVLASSVTSAGDVARHFRRTRVRWPWRWFVRFKPGEQLASRRQPIETIELVEEPILLVHGRDDQITPIEFSRRLAQAAGPHARLLEVPGQGHVLDLTAAEPIRSIRAFVHAEADPS